MSAAPPRRPVGPRLAWCWVRSFVFQCLLVLSVLVFSLPVIAGLLLPGSRRRWHYAYPIARAWAGLVIWLLRVVCGIRSEVRGREHLPARPSVIMMKHQSAWETIAQFTIFPPQCWVLKRELMAIPFLGWALLTLKPIPIDRSRGRDALQSVVSVGGQRLAEGIWVVVFPEGTRVAPGQTRRYRAGGAVLAQRSGAAIVPVAHNAGSCWLPGTMLKVPGRITLSIGPAIAPGTHDAETLLRMTQTWIEGEQQHLDPPADTPTASTP